MPEVKTAVSQDHATALKVGFQSETLFENKKLELLFSHL